MAGRSNSTATDPTRKKPLPEIREEFEYYQNEWRAIRDAAADDMAYVSGNPFDADDLEARGERPTVAPDEMTQYRVQVTNALRKAPRGVKFQPKGRGAGEKSAEFYQQKMREVEYRSHGVEHYIGAAENVLQRSYGAFRIDIRYEDPRAVNPEVFIDGFPDPDVVLPDPTIKQRNGLDAKGAFVLETMRRSEFLRRWPGAEVRNFSDYMDRYKGWIHPGLGGLRVQVAEAWKQEFTKRELHAVAVGGQGIQRSKPIALFKDEIAEFLKSRPMAGLQVLADRVVRDVDYPKVVRRITNGLEVLETEPWPGKYIPIVMMFGPILYVPKGGTVEKQILSMTRPMKAPWKSYCYASSQELEVLGQVPKASVVVYKGQLANLEDQWEESLYTPKAFLEAHARIPGMREGEERLPLPTRMEYTQAEYLQAIEEVKEGFRRAIQAAAGSNFLPTQAQRINDKSGEALKRIDEAATQGTWHFVDAYESGIQACGVICEDLFDKVYDFEGETGVVNPKGEARTVPINIQTDPNAYHTFGDHLVTITTAPSSDSEYDAASDFIDSLLSNLQAIAEVAGRPVAAYILAQSITMKHLGVEGEELAQAIMPPQFRQQGKDGKPVDPALVAAQQQIQALQQKLQAATSESQQKIQLEMVKGRIKGQIEAMKVQASSSDQDKDRAVKLEVAAIQAKIETWAMVLDELERLGGLSDAQAERLHGADQQRQSLAHDTIERTKDRIHERATQHVEHAQAKALLAQGALTDAASSEQEASLGAAQADRDAANQAAVAGAAAAAKGPGSTGAGGE